MADNTFRANRSRDPIARENVELKAGDLGDNPLADLARLIGQRQRINEFDRTARYNGSVQTLDQPAADQDWAEDERSADEQQPHADESYAQPRLPDYPLDRGHAQHDDTRAAAPAPRHAEPAPQPYEARYHDDDEYDEQYRDDPHDETRSYEPRYREEPPHAVARQVPDLAPQSHDDYDEQWDDESDIPEDYDDSTGTTRRSGLAIVLAVLGLVLIGAAGAYAYRALYGGAILVPSLPPIIKPADGPNKIVPTPPSGSANTASGVNPSAPAQLMPREEQPVPVQPPPAPPRVLSTIPVAPAPGATPSPFDAPSAPNVIGQVPAPATPTSTPVAPKATAPAQPQAPSTEPKKIHTVPIRPDQGADASAAAPMPVAPAAAPAPAPRARTAEPTPRPAPPSVSAPKGSNAPLSLVPGGQSAAPAVEPPPRTRVAHAEPPPSAPVATAPAATAPIATTPAAAAPAAGGYAVQVTSQRSEAEAQSAFRELQAKYPTQLGNRQPIIHRADLAEKGTYYRAMVGPFGSAEAAASLCSSIKAAGGSCIVQKN